MSIVTAAEPPVHISEAIRKASRKTGADFNYLLTTAARESAFKPAAQARTSSAAGLFQFIDTTWLQTVKEEGPRFGLGDYANKIFRTESGKYYVPDDKARAQILRLRYDPEVASVMAGAFTNQNAEYLGSRIGRDPSQGELYIAHFLGAEGANKLITLSEDSPYQRADRHFPRAAEANRGIFYTHGTPNTVSQVYENLVSDHGRLEASTMASLPAAEVQKVAASSGDASPSGEQPGIGKRIQLAAASLLDVRPDVAGLFKGPVIGPPRISLAGLLKEEPAYRPATLGAVPDDMKSPQDAVLTAPGIAEAVALEIAQNKGSTGSIGVWTTMVLHPDETATPLPPAVAVPARKPDALAARGSVEPDLPLRKPKRAEVAQPARRAIPRTVTVAHGNGVSRAERFSTADFWQSVRNEGS